MEKNNGSIYAPVFFSKQLLHNDMCQCRILFWPLYIYVIKYNVTVYGFQIRHILRILKRKKQSCESFFVESMKNPKEKTTRGYIS